MNKQSYLLLTISHYIKAVSSFKTQKAIFFSSGDIQLIHMEVNYLYTQGLEQWFLNYFLDYKPLWESNELLLSPSERPDEEPLVWGDGKSSLPLQRPGFPPFPPPYVLAVLIHSLVDHPSLTGPQAAWIWSLLLHTSYLLLPGLSCHLSCLKGWLHFLTSPLPPQLCDCLGRATVNFFFFFLWCLAKNWEHN